MESTFGQTGKHPSSLYPMIKRVDPRRQASHCHQTESPISTLWVERNEATRTIIPCHWRFTRSNPSPECSGIAHQVAERAVNHGGTRDPSARETHYRLNGRKNTRRLCPPCVCYQFITATHTGYFRIPACATAPREGDGGGERPNRRRARSGVSENI